MTKDEISERYCIPTNILDDYQSMGLGDGVRVHLDDGHYDEHDLKCLSMILALYDMGFTKEDVEAYMKLLLQGEETEQVRLKMLNDQRQKTLDAIHLQEQQIAHLDHLRHEIRKHQEKNRQMPNDAKRHITMKS